MEIFQKYGYTLEGITSFTLAGKEGVEKIKEAMSELRDKRPMSFGGWKVSGLRDYLKSVRYDFITGEKQPLLLPASDVLYFEMKDSAWFCIRPSGTEPKIKIYFGVTEKSMASAQEKLKMLQDEVLSKVKPLLF